MNRWLASASLAAAPGLCLLVACTSVTNVGTVDPAADSGTSPTGTPTAPDGGSPKDGGLTPPGAKRIFVTSQKLKGDLGGLDGADGTCESTAQAAGLGGTWKVWLSTSTVNAINRLTDVGPWYDLEGTLIFQNKASLVEEPASGLWYDESGEFLPSDRIWTGTGFDGQYIEDLGPGSKPCGDWTVATMSETAKIGQVGRKDSSAWTAYAGTTCDQEAHLICFEQ